MNKKREINTTKLVLTALMAALCYIGFTYFRVDIPVGAGQTSIHFGNAFLILAALLLGGVYGGIAGAVGMGIGDLFIPAYVLVAPKTIFLKFMIGLICGTVAHKICKIENKGDKGSKRIVRISLIATITAMAFNVIFDPVIGYFYSLYILGAHPDASKILATWAAGTTTINAVTSVLIATSLYNLLRPALIKSGLYSKLQRQGEIS